MVEARRSMECATQFPSPVTEPRQSSRREASRRGHDANVVYGPDTWERYSPLLADFGTPIVCCDTAEHRILELAQGRAAFYEKNLEEIIRRNVRAGRLTYSCEIETQVGARR